MAVGLSVGRAAEFQEVPSANGGKSNVFLVGRLVREKTSVCFVYSAAAFRVKNLACGSNVHVVVGGSASRQVAERSARLLLAPDSVA